VLGVEPGSSQATIKAAWRRLAREHHPDLATSDPVAARRATRRMAEINAAYEALRSAADPGRRATGGGTATRAASGAGRGGDGRRSDRPAGPPPPPRSRPVTARVDTSQTVRPRNATLGHPASPMGQAPPPNARPTTEPLRASDPNGPIQKGRMRHYRRPPEPPIEEAAGLRIDFGKFRGHTLGEIAAFEPSYIDWLAGTITRDRDLVASARVLQADLDRRGVVRRVRPSQPTRRSPYAGPLD
jgi:curved DNA-binding protein CbpA